MSTVLATCESHLQHVNHLSLILKGHLQCFLVVKPSKFWTCSFEFLLTRKQFPLDVIQLFAKYLFGIHYSIPAKKESAGDDHKTSGIGWSNVSMFEHIPPTNQPLILTCQVIGLINQRPFQDPKFQVPTIYSTIYKAYVREYPWNIWPETWY